jgi:hypothetical protein
MYAGVLRLRHDLQVAGVVVPLVSVPVVDDFSFLQWTAKHLLGNGTVHVSAHELDVVCAAARVAFKTRVAKRIATTLLV